MYHHLGFLVVYGLAASMVFRLYCETFDRQSPIPATSLNAKALRNVLEKRGILSPGVVERNDLVDMVSASGDVYKDELEPADDQQAEEVHVFQGSSHFYEQVEDCKDSAWLVQVIASGSMPLFHPASWEGLSRDFAKFSIRVGTFDCRLDPMLCAARNWNTSTILLALPGSQAESKGRVTMMTLPGPPCRTTIVKRWVFSQLQTRVSSLPTQAGLAKWYKDYCLSDVCVVLISSLALPPVFISALSVKFSGRVRFGITSQMVGASLVPDASPGHEMGASQPAPRNRSQPGRYAVLWGSRGVLVGDRRGEMPGNFASLRSFLRFIRPDMNDVFILSLGFVNVLAVLTIFEYRSGSPLMHLLRFAWALFKYNLALLLFWALVLTSTQIPEIGRSVLQFSVKFYRFLVFNERALQVRADWTRVGRYPFAIPASYVLFCGVLAWLRRRPWWPFSAADSQTYRTAAEQSWIDWLSSYGHPRNAWNPPPQPGAPAVGFASDNEQILQILNQMGTVDMYLPPQQQGSDSESGSEYIRPRVPLDYIRDLPVFFYTAEAVPADVKAGREKTEGKHCVRCKLVRHLRLSRLASRLRSSPCRKCGWAGEAGGRANERADASLDCRVCLECYAHGEECTTLPCGHAYHRRCILPWLLSGHHVCPLCRAPSNKT